MYLIKASWIKFGNQEPTVRPDRLYNAQDL